MMMKELVLLSLLVITAEVMVAYGFNYVPSMEDTGEFTSVDFHHCCSSDRKDFVIKEGTQGSQETIRISFCSAYLLAQCEVHSNCQEWYNSGNLTSGIYRINPDRGVPFKVYCKMDEVTGAGSVVIQRRIDGTVDFFRGYTSYVNGFGDLEGEFWLGLRNIHRLTQNGLSMLRVDLEDFDGKTRFATYSSFNIGNSSTGYALNISGYSGNAGDSLQYHNGFAFSTNDFGPFANCAVGFHGAWWYYNCHRSNLNGLYIPGGAVELDAGYGIVWVGWRGFYRSMKHTEMTLQ